MIAPVEDLPQPLSGNKAIEEAAIAFVMRLELEAGRSPIDRRYVTSFPADIESAPRIIEVKAVGGSQRGMVSAAGSAPGAGSESQPHFWIYIVDNVRQGDSMTFGLKVLGRELGYSRRPAERRYYGYRCQSPSTTQRPGEGRKRSRESCRSVRLERVVIVRAEDDRGVDLETVRSSGLVISTKRTPWPPPGARARRNKAANAGSSSISRRLRLMVSPCCSASARAMLNAYPAWLCCETGPPCCRIRRLRLRVWPTCSSVAPSVNR